MGGGIWRRKILSSPANATVLPAQHPKSKKIKKYPNCAGLNDFKKDERVKYRVSYRRKMYGNVDSFLNVCAIIGDFH